MAFEPLPTLWEVPDPLWELFASVLERYDPPKKMGRPRIDARLARNAMIYRMRTGGQWNQLPPRFGDNASIHRTQQRWEQRAIFDLFWALVQARCQDLDGVDWQWQAAAGCLNKAPGGRKREQDECRGPNPTDRGKQGVGKSLLAEGDDGPLAVVVTGANVNDRQLLAVTLDAIVVARPHPSEERPQHLCLDKGYGNQTGEQAALEAGYIPHIRRIGEEKRDENQDKRHPARRWVVERTFGWLHWCRGILIRWEKKASNSLAVVKLACSLLWFRRLDGLVAAVSQAVRVCPMTQSGYQCLCISAPYCKHKMSIISTEQHFSRMAVGLTSVQPNRSFSMCIFGAASGTRSAMTLAGVFTALSGKARFCATVMGADTSITADENFRSDTTLLRPADCWRASSRR